MNLLRLLPEGITPQDAVMGMAGLTAAVTAIVIWQTLTVRDRFGPRLRLLSRKRAALKGEFLAGTPDAVEPATMPGIRRIVERLKLIKGKDAETASLLLSRAGLRSRDALVVYQFMRLCLPFAFGALGLVLLYLLQVPKLPDNMRALLTFVLVVIGAFAPKIYVRNATQKRQHQITRALPDTLDLLVISAEAGLSLDAAFNRVSKELAPAWPEMADELALASIELTFLSDRRRAMDNFAQRIDLESIRAVINTLRQSEKYGTPLAQSLRMLSAEFRNARMMKAEEKAARLPVLMTLPMVMFILPPLFIVLIGPAILQIIDQLAKL
ncbi:MAG: type II secretion system F family protein [Rhodospirillales bacterium]